MKKQKYQPYAKIIDLKLEQEEYVRLCDGKSELYLTYTSWERHIKERLSKIENATDLYNFKRYCINQDRVYSNIPELFGSYTLLLITIVFDKIEPCLSIIGIVAAALYFVWYVLIRHKRVIKGSCFFKDIIEVIEKIEKEK